jgi:hypothetical protein
MLETPGTKSITPNSGTYAVPIVAPDSAKKALVPVENELVTTVDRATTIGFGDPVYAVSIIRVSSDSMALAKRAFERAIPRRERRR